ncbi:MAG: zinc metallopeptidase [Anaerolineae bacterium]
MIFFDPIFLAFIIPTMILGFIAQNAVRSRFKKYSRVHTFKGLTGAQAAREILDSNGLYDVRIEEARGGQLSDHYDPRQRVLRLSHQVARYPTVASVGVAAHEAGHALQHATGYFPLQIRSAMVPAVQFGSRLAPWIILGGIVLQGFLGFPQLGYTVAWLGVLAYGLVALFSIVTLPVEINASVRAKKLLYQYNIVDRQELDGVNKVLAAAAWTYVVAALAAIMQLAYWVFRLSGSRRN